MLKYYDGTEVLKCDILKVAHHGSKSSSSEAFLDAAAPDIAVIQVGPGNFYGHPHAQTIERLEARGIRIYRTDLDGAVGIDIRKDRIKVDTFRQRRADGL
jgi:competence protein ComEC